MKKLLFIPISLLLFMTVEAQKVVSGADRSFKESLNKYTTFGWSENINEIPSDAVFVGPSGVYIFNNESTKAKIKEAIHFELNAKGYKETETNPDILVLFRITEQKGDLETFKGYEEVAGVKVRTNDDKVKVDIQPGTLLINLLDRNTGKVAWQGYASGILNADMINDNVKVREAVAAIFKDFKFHVKN